MATIMDRAALSGGHIAGDGSLEGKTPCPHFGGELG